MDAYVTALRHSSIPFHPLGLIAVWAAAFGGTHLIIWQSGKCAQTFIVTGAPAGLVRSLSLRLVVGQILFATLVFALAFVGGGAAIVFLGGGMVAALVTSTALSMRRLLFVKALSMPEAVSGTVTLSSRLAVRSMAFEFLSAGAACLG